MFAQMMPGMSCVIAWNHHLELYQENIDKWVIRGNSLLPALPFKTTLMEIMACAYSWRYLKAAFKIQE
jgi:hypothetical protein